MGTILFECPMTGRPSRKAARWLQNGFRMVCAGLPLAPLISRWARALWSAGPPAHTFNTLARGVYSLQFPPVDIDGLMCADAITPKRLWRFPGSQVLDRWCGCWIGASAVAAPVSGLFNFQPTKRITRANRLSFGPGHSRQPRYRHGPMRSPRAACPWVNSTFWPFCRQVNSI
jgi:hypothetical protein